MIDTLLVAKDLIKREEYPSAFKCLNQCMNEEPESPEAQFLMGLTLRELGYLGLALLCLRRALASDKTRKQTSVWNHYAATLHDLDRYEEARDAFMMVHRAMPNEAKPLANIAATYVQQAKYRDAIEWADRSLKIDPDCHIARISKALACLALGRWTDAWENKAWLYGTQLNVRVYKDEGDWDGTKGQTVVVNADQGLGDQIMFAQCLPQLVKDSKKVIVECAPRMVEFFRSNFEGIQVEGTGKQTKFNWPEHEDIDAHVHISYLGNWYRRRDQDFPRKSYITPAPFLVEKWQTWLKKFPKPWVGIAWQGGLLNTMRRFRSVALQEFAPILEIPGTYIDLSYHDSTKEVARWNIDNITQVIRPPIDATNYQDTIALVSCLDDVVCVTTTLLHVCGALGRHAYVITPEAPQWREAHRMEDESMIWYPPTSIKLYRQKPGEKNFGQTINRVVKDMTKIYQLRAA